MTENEIAKQIVDAVLKIHNRFGPGLLESVYEAVLAAELERREVRVSGTGLASAVFAPLRHCEKPVFCSLVSRNGAKAQRKTANQTARTLLAAIAL